MPQEAGIGCVARTLAASLWFFPTPEMRKNVAKSEIYKSNGLQVLGQQLSSWFSNLGGHI
jgi:hypothetical protein